MTDSTITEATSWGISNVKIANIAIFLGVMSIGLTHGAVPLYAQSTSALVLTGGDDKPWNRGVSTEVRRVARDLFLEGNRLFRIPLFAQAVEKYAAALGKWKHPAFYFNLALAQLNLGQEVEARENLAHALEQGEEPLGTEEFKEAQKQLHDVERQLGRIHISCETPGAEVTLDGVTLFTGPGSFQKWVSVKAHELMAKKQGYLSDTRRVTMAPGHLQAITLKLITLSEAADTGRRWATWKPWTVVAAGAAVVASSGILHVLSFRNFHDYDQKFQGLGCAISPGCTEEEIGPKLNAQLGLATREQKLAVGGYIVGGSVITAGVVLMYLNRPRLLEQGAARLSAGDVVIAPIVLTDMLGILARTSY